MTICIAGIHDVQKGEKSIFAIFDRKTTTLGGWHSSDGSAWKMRNMNGRWAALLAGHISEMTAIADAVKMGTKGSLNLNWRQYARECAKAYREERERLVESEILTDYDISSYADYLSLKSSDRKLFDAIGRVLHDFDENLNLLMLGFDKHKEPHIFLITGRGKIQYCDLQGYGVAGSGSWAAMVSLDRHPYDKWKPLGDCIYAVLAAKFAAEAADGVGKDTALFVFTPSHPKGQGSALKTNLVDEIKDKWLALPKIPEGVPEELEREFSNFIQMMRKLKRVNYQRPRLKK